MHPHDPRSPDDDAERPEPDAPDIESDSAPAESDSDQRPIRGLDILSADDLDDDDFLDEDDEDFDDEDDGVRVVLITGACGVVGRKLREAWDELYDLVLIDAAADPDDPEVVAADLSEMDESWLTHFHGVDTVVHLAGSADEQATWEDLERSDLDALANVFHASALAGVERVIFASSHAVMGGYRELADMTITEDLPPKPDGPFGAAKLAGERFGRSLGRAFHITFIALRLGRVQDGENLPDTLHDDWARAMWLSNDDLARLFEGAVEAELDDRYFLAVNGMSNNRGMRWDLSAAADLLEFAPEDDAYAEEI